MEKHEQQKRFEILTINGSNELTNAQRGAFDISVK